MKDKNDALFLVSLPFGQKTIPYEEVSELIAMAKSPGYDHEKASGGHEDVIFALSALHEEGLLKAAVRTGEVEVLNKSLHRMSLPVIGRLEDTVLTVRALREYVESIQGFLEVEDAPAPQPNTPQPQQKQESANEWVADAQSRAHEIIKEQRARDLYPDQLGIADQIAKEFRAAGKVGADGKPISGAYIKRHALKGITSAIVKQLSTTNRQSK